MADGLSVAKLAWLLFYGRRVATLFLLIAAGVAVEMVTLLVANPVSCG